MNKYKRVLYQEQEIERLNKIITKLNHENNVLTSQLDTNKNILLLREKEFNEKERQLEKLKLEYITLINELKQTKLNYKKAIEKDFEFRNKIKKEISLELKRIRKQK